MSDKSTDETLEKPVFERVVLPTVETPARRPRKERVVADTTPRLTCRFCMKQVARLCDPTLMLECDHYIESKA